MAKKTILLYLKSEASTITNDGTLKQHEENRGGKIPINHYRRLKRLLHKHHNEPMATVETYRNKYVQDKPAKKDDGKGLRNKRQPARSSR